MLRMYPIHNRWCIHSYYTLNPYAPDGSGRILISGFDPATNLGEVMILSPEGRVLKAFGRHQVNTGFYHTGFWQTWSPDSGSVYYQAGTLQNPMIARYDLSTDTESLIPGDMEGAQPAGEPVFSGLMGMLYAAGYADSHYHPELAPVAFQDRHKHGIFEYCFSPQTTRLRLSVADMLARHPQRELLDKADAEIRRRLGPQDGLTLMLYCLRWCPDGSRFLFYFGNHCVAKERNEPRIAFVMTSDRNLSDIHLAVDLSFSRCGVHWGWQPDNLHLIGYGPDPDNPTAMCLASVRYDGTDYRRLSRNSTGGHPTISPADPHLIVTDNYAYPGVLQFIDARTDTLLAQHSLPRSSTSTPPTGRNHYFLDLHPVFHPSGRYVLVNTMQDRLGVIAEIDVPERTMRL